jgi:hypothetical protein
MTAKQRREHKQFNQKRKAEILHAAKKGPKEDRAWYAKMGTCQDGKYTRK